jgi:V8-like Glu-specific endopeptidase
MTMLTIEERRSVVNILADLYDFTEGPRARRVLIEQAGLRRFLRGLDLSGAPGTVAGDLIGRLENFGALPERPTHHALGALLCYVLTLSDVPPDQAKVLAQLIVRHALVGDPRYIGDLREKYQIADAPPPEAPAGVTEAPSPKSVAERAVPFEPHIEEEDEHALERIISSEDNFLDLTLLQGALYCAAAVCRIEFPPGEPLGTGVLIGPDLLLTNQHVLDSKNLLEDARARFDYSLDEAGVAAAGRVFRFDKDFYHASPSKELDYALVKLQAAPLAALAPPPEAAEATIFTLIRTGKHRGYLSVAPRFIKDKDRVNVIQHPDGQPMKVVMTQNYVSGDMTGTRVHYVADTMEGSSGSPVFNRNWEIVALHHSGYPYPRDGVVAAGKRLWKGKFRVNEGVPMRAILEDFKQKGLDRYLPKQ